jgi:hypothetical protein
MKPAALLAASLALLPLAAPAASPFDGTWRADFKSVRIIKNAEYGWQIRDGRYRCTKNCFDHLDEVATDGQDHPIAGHARSDHLAVALQGDSKAVLTYKQAAKVVMNCTLSVDANGSRLRQDCTDYTGPKPSTFGTAMKRVGQPEPGAHRVSGVWAQEDGSWAGSELTLTLAVQGDHIRTVLDDVVTNARFDGRDYPSENDPSHTLNVFRKVSEREIEWQMKMNGKPLSRETLVVSRDNASILNTVWNLLDGSETSMVLRRMH